MRRILTAAAPHVVYNHLVHEQGIAAWRRAGTDPVARHDDGQRQRLWGALKYTLRIDGCVSRGRLISVEAHHRQRPDQQHDKDRHADQPGDAECQRKQPAEPCSPRCGHRRSPPGPPRRAHQRDDHPGRSHAEHQRRRRAEVDHSQPCRQHHPADHDERRDGGQHQRAFLVPPSSRHVISPSPGLPFSPLIR